MKHAIIAKYILLTTLFIISIASACTTPTTELIVPSDTNSVPLRFVSSTPTVKPSLILPTTSSKPPATIEPFLPADTPTPNGDVTWATGIDIQQINGVFDHGSWSPTAEEIVYFPANQYDTNDIVLMRFASPDFQPKEIRAIASTSLDRMDHCGYPHLLWSRNGQRIFFSGPLTNPSERSMEPCSIWMVEHDGRDPRPYYPEQSGRSVSPAGWIDDHSLLITGYREGIRVFDLLTGKNMNWALPRFYGIPLFTRDYFVGTDGSDIYHMYALGRRDEPIDEILTDGPDNLKYARTPPPDRTYDWTGHSWFGHTILYDALPDTNQVLGYWSQYIEDGTDPNNLKAFPVQKLVLWDIDQDSLTTLVPYGLWGRFSPDKYTLAYLTDGPAILDAENRPVDPNNTNQSNLYNNDTNITYLQLLDRNTGLVFLSVPVISYHDFYDNEFLHVGVNFSPDGQFLSFITDRKIAFDDQGWPEMVQPKSVADNSSHLYVLDLKNRCLIWDQSGLAPIPHRPEYVSTLENRLANWSPKNKQFIYLDAENNPILVNLNSGVRTPITLKTSGMPRIEWSASGNYAAVQIPDGYSWKISFLKIP